MNTGWIYTQTHTHKHTFGRQRKGKSMSERIMGNSEHQKRKKHQTQIWIAIKPQEGENREPSLEVPNLQKLWFKMYVKAQSID